MFVADHPTLEQLQELTRARHPKRIRRRAQAVVLAERGRTAQDIADALGRSLKAVKDRVARYNAGGIDALHERPRSGRPPSLDPAQYPRLKRRPGDPPRPEDGACALRGGDVRRILERESGASRSLQAVDDPLHRPGYSDLRPRPRHEGADREVPEFFKGIVVEPSGAIAERHPDRTSRVSFEDEARFGAPGTIARVWAPKGSRPRAVRQDGREWLYVLMAVGVDPGAAAAPIMPELNTGAVDLSLERSSGAWPTGAHAVLIRDGAGDHTGGDLAVPSDVSLIRLPPDAPELDPVEDLWHYPRAPHGSNREYEGDEGLRREAVRSLLAVSDADTLKSICNADYVQQRV